MKDLPGEGSVLCLDYIDVNNLTVVLCRNSTGGHRWGKLRKGRGDLSVKDVSFRCFLKLYRNLHLKIKHLI